MKVKTEEELREEDPKYFLVKNDTKLKELIVNYVGEQLHPLKPEVTVEDIVNIFADEFPEFLMVVAQENFLRGYTTGLEDAKI
tara:strand:+ start:100 stop:348 length:249 start_codon:yes stop_codon:yes gene_type:complete